MSKTSTIVLGASAMSITRDPAASNVADLIERLNITGVSGVFNAKPVHGKISTGVITGNYLVGDTITGGTSGATGTFTGYEGTAAAPVLVMSNIVGTFVSGELLTGAPSGATATSSSAVTPLNYTGEWTYPYNTMTILQVEKVDGSRLSIELQDVSIPNTWNNGSLANLQQAIADINAWL